MHYKIDIPKPCHENWQEMTPTEKGKFCVRCEKEVFDFSGLSKYEITQEIKHNKNLCGRFQQNQLDQEYVVSRQNNLSRLGLVFGIGSLLAFCQPAQAQQKREKQISVLSSQKKDTSKTSINIQELLENRMPICGFDEFIIIKGTITDDAQTPLPGALIGEMGASNTVETDFDGNYFIYIPKDNFDNQVVLTFSAPGFDAVLKTVTKDQTAINLAFSPAIAGELVVRHPNIFQHFFNFFRKKENCKY